MTLNELMDEMAVMVDDEYSLVGGQIPDKVLRWFNGCSRDIVEQARYVGRATYEFINPDSIEEIAVPDSFYKPVPRGFLWLDDEELSERLVNDTRTGFRRWGKTIILKDVPEGTLTMYYYRKLPLFTGDPTEEPVIPEPFHDIYAMYAAVKHVQSLWDEIDIKRDYGEEYQYKRNELDLYTLANDTAPYPVTSGQIRYDAYDEEFDTNYDYEK